MSGQPHTSVEVTHLPDCDLCQHAGTKSPAYADARIPSIGSWAYLCRAHFDMCYCQLGLGRGQRLILTLDERSM